MEEKLSNLESYFEEMINESSLSWEFRQNR